MRAPVPTIACQRCRSKKIRCDRNMPRCRCCERANVPCVTLDVSGRPIPRSYLAHLETRVKELEETLASNIQISGKSPEEVSGPKVRGFLGASAGLTFANILNAALKEQLGNRQVNNQVNTTPLVHRKPLAVSEIQLPPKEMAENYLSVYFQLANSQMPILHREDFIQNHFVPVYGSLSPSVSLANEHTKHNLDIGDQNTVPLYYSPSMAKQLASPSPDTCKSLYFLFQIFAIAGATTQQHYDSSLVETLHLSAMTYYADLKESCDHLELLQVILLLALYSIMRPASPGIWYTVGTATRLCVELGLHDENKRIIAVGEKADPLTVDMCRRLFWCTYALDRQTSVYLGRPLGIAEHLVHTPFPSLLDDSQLRVPTLGTALSETQPPSSYKCISYAFFEIRQIQGFIQNVLYDGAEIPRACKNLQEWRHQVRVLLDYWHQRAPKEVALTNCKFNNKFLDLNYQHARLLLHGVCPANPHPSEADMAESALAGLAIIDLYVTLAESKQLNYSWSAVHNLFLAGASYLFALYHNATFRLENDIGKLQVVVGDVSSTLTELSNYCDAANNCRDSFVLLSQAVMELMQQETSVSEMPSAATNTVQDFLQQAAEGSAAFVGQGLEEETGPWLAESSDSAREQCTGPRTAFKGSDLFNTFYNSADRLTPPVQHVSVGSSQMSKSAPNVYNYLNEMSRNLIWNNFVPDIRDAESAEGEELFGPMI